MNTFTEFIKPNSIGRKRLSWYVMSLFLFVAFFLSHKLSILQQNKIESESKLNRIVKGSDSGFWEWYHPTSPTDFNSYVWYSDQFNDLLGYRIKDVGSNLEWLLQKVHHDDRLIVERQISNTVNNLSSFNIKCRIKTANDTYMWFTMRGTPFFDKNGKLSYISGSIHSLNELMVATLRLEQLVNTAPVAMILCDSNRNVSGYSYGAEDMFGWTKQEMFGKPVDTLVAAEYEDKHASAMKQRLETIKKSKDDVYICKTITGVAKHKNGTLFNVNMSVNAFKYNGIIEFVAIITSNHQDKFGAK